MNLDYEKKEVSNTQIDLMINISKSDLGKEYDKQLKKLSKGVEMKGFRKGKAPSNVVESSVGAKAQQLALEKLLPKYATEILQKEDILPAAPLSYQIENVDVKKGAKIKAIVQIVPPFDLPNISSLKEKVKKESSIVTEKDVDELIKHMWNEHRDKAKNKDDSWVKALSKKLGFKSKTMTALRKELKDSIRSEKGRLVVQKYQGDLMSKTIGLAGVEVPDGMVHVEAEARENSFNTQVKSMKVTPEQFCKIRGVTMEQMRDKWMKDSKEALKNDLLLSKYAKERGLGVSKSELENEVEMIKKRSPSDDSKLFDNKEWRGYIGRVILKRKAFQSFLEEVDPETFKLKSSKKKGLGEPK